MNKMGEKKVIKLVTMTIGLLFFTLSLNSSFAAIDDTAPSPISNQTILKNYKDGLVHCEFRIIKKGEHLWKILEVDYGVPYNKIPFYLRMLRDLNPGVDEIGNIEAQQKVLIPYKYITKVKTPSEEGASPSSSTEENKAEKDIPLKKPDKFTGQGADTEEVITSKVDSLEIFQPDHSSKDNEIKSPVKYIHSEEPKSVSLNEPENESDQNLNKSKPGRGQMVKNFLRSIAFELGGNLIYSGDYYIPVEGRGRLVLNTSSFPIMQLMKNKTLIINFNNKLSAAIEEIIDSHLMDYTIVSIDQDQKLESILDKIFAVSGYFSVAKDIELLVAGDNELKVKLSGKWFVFKDKLKKDGYCINLIKNSEEAASPFLKSFVQDLGIRIIDILPGREGTIGIIFDKPALESDNFDGNQKIDATNLENITDSLLELIAQPYIKDKNIPILHSPDNTYTLQITANRIFQVDGKDCIIVFQKLPKKLVNIIEGEEILLLQIEEEKDLRGITAKILDVMGIDYTELPRFNASKGDKTGRITVIIPGILFLSKKDAPIFLTDLEICDDIKHFLQEKKVKLATY